MCGHKCLAYAMARDGGLPFHHQVVRLSKTNKIPVLATVVTVSHSAGSGKQCYLHSNDSSNVYQYCIRALHCGTDSDTSVQEQFCQRTLFVGELWDSHRQLGRILGCVHVPVFLLLSILSGDRNQLQLRTNEHGRMYCY